jgi:hypothetical protein
MRDIQPQGAVQDAEHNWLLAQDFSAKRAGFI